MARGFVACVIVVAACDALQASPEAAFWPPAATRDCVACAPLGMGEYGSRPAIFVRVAGADALPVEVGADAQLAMERAVRGEVVGKVQTLSVAQGLVNRDGGLFDNLPYELGPTAFSKKDIFDRVKGKDWPGRSLTPQNVFDGLLGKWGGGAAERGEGEDEAPYRGAYGFRPAVETPEDRAFAGYASPYALFLEAVQDVLGCDVGEALLEDACPLDGVAELAGAVRLDRRDGGASLVVDCDADEAVGLALAAGCALFAMCDVADALAVPASAGLARRTKVAPLRLRYAARDDRDVVDSAAALAAGAVAPEAIASGADYESMTVQAKLETLAGADEARRAKIALPRPRVLAGDADAVVDALLLPLCDEIVRREVQIEAALRDGDVAAAARLIAGKSQRHRARDAAAAASAQGRLAAEAAARQEDAILSAIRADVTQDEGSYDPYLDQDRWYEEGRRKSMGL